MYIVKMPDASNAMEINLCHMQQDKNKIKIHLTLHRNVPILLAVYKKMYVT